jgi:hypothetical protein
MKLSHQEVIQHAVLRMLSYAGYLRLATEHGHAPLNPATFAAHVAGLEAKIATPPEVTPLREHVEWDVKLTAGSGKPTVEGVYRTNATSAGTYQRWDGAYWHFYARAFDDAADATRGRSISQSVHWWGLPEVS